MSPSRASMPCPCAVSTRALRILSAALSPAALGAIPRSITSRAGSSRPRLISASAQATHNSGSVGLMAVAWRSRSAAFSGWAWTLRTLALITDRDPADGAARRPRARMLSISFQSLRATGLRLWISSSRRARAVSSSGLSPASRMPAWISDRASSNRPADWRILALALRGAVNLGSEAMASPYSSIALDSSRVASQAAARVRWYCGFSQGMTFRRAFSSSAIDSRGRFSFSRRRASR